MTLQQVKYAVSALAIAQVVIIIAAIVLISKHVVNGIRNSDRSKFRKAAVVFAIAFGLLVILGIAQFLILLK
jgi:3-dehydroquinate dehydratase